jgi:hypothetical protein
MAARRIPCFHGKIYASNLWVVIRGVWTAIAADLKLILDLVGPKRNAGNAQSVIIVSRLQEALLN